jgi:Kef-type K+ transport system membrane component KefB
MWSGSKRITVHFTTLLANTGTIDIGYIAILIGLLLSGALVVKELMLKLKQPVVLGEVLFGVLIGNWLLPEVRENTYIKLLSEIGILVLMFEAGLESSVGKMLKVGTRAFLVALGGAAASITLGYFLTRYLFAQSHPYSQLFLGITIAATSVGISARVLKELRQGGTPTNNMIVGAAVIDDILGLIALALINGLILNSSSGESVSLATIGFIALKAIGFLVISLFIGVKLSLWLFPLATKLQSEKILLTIGFSFCLLLSWLSTLAGLAAMIGAYAAGLIVEDVHYKDLSDREEHTLEEVMRPLSEFFVPIFFVMVGTAVNIEVLFNLHTLQLASLLTLTAILGKAFCIIGTWGDKTVNKLAVVIGMVPRGEVVIIIASAGKTLSINGQPVITESLYSAIIVVVIITTLLTPPALKWAFERSKN